MDWGPRGTDCLWLWALEWEVLSLVLEVFSHEPLPSFSCLPEPGSMCSFGETTVDLKENFTLREIPRLQVGRIG